ncbi:hypothetical protein GEMRC1_010500 [Eukaryota sp. GEM-RC1]
MDPPTLLSLGDDNVSSTPAPHANVPRQPYSNYLNDLNISINSSENSDLKPLFQHTFVAVSLLPSTVGGHGVFADKSISKFTLICAYDGIVLTDRHSIDYSVNLQRKHYPDHVSYTMVCKDDESGLYAIDGSLGKSAAKFINHSRAPNCTCFWPTEEFKFPIIVSFNKIKKKGRINH